MSERGFEVTEIILSGIIGLLIGAGGIAAIMAPHTQKPADVQIVAKELTNLDLTKPICDPKYIEAKGDLLCRELTCLQFSRGLDSKTGGNQCESISNIANKKQIMGVCSLKKTPDEAKECLELFWRRN